MRNAPPPRRPIAHTLPNRHQQLPPTPSPSHQTGGAELTRAGPSEAQPDSKRCVLTGSSADAAPRLGFGAGGRGAADLGLDDALDGHLLHHLPLHDALHGSLPPTPAHSRTHPNAEPPIRGFEPLGPPSRLGSPPATARVVDGPHAACG